MIWRGAKVGIQQLFSAWLITSAFGLDGYKYSVDFFHHSWVVELQNPAAIGLIVHVEDSHVDKELFVRGFLAPGLKVNIPHTRLFVEVKCVKLQRFVLGIKDATKRLSRMALRIDIEYIGNQEVARAHEFDDVTIRGQELPLLLYDRIARVNLGGEIVDGFLRAGSLQKIGDTFRLQPAQVLAQ